MSIQVLIKNKLLSDTYMEYRKNRYQILFDNDDVYHSLKRVSYTLGEPLWMFVYGWVKFQPLNKKKKFWKLKKNII